jgi:SAM-dependent methyltransferase
METRCEKKMEEQKLIQKEWYESQPLPRGRDIIQIATTIHINRLKSLFPVKEANLSLNCGCGKGGQKNLLGPSIGIDISFENVRSLIKAGGQGVVADVEFIPFRDRTFDIVYGFGILHHLSDIKKGVLEATRVLKKGGYIGFGGENNGLCPFTYIIALLYQNWKIEKGSYRIRKGNLGKIFRDSGITGLKISRNGMTIYGMGRIIYRLTSFMEKRLSHFALLKPFLGHCYIAGRKI